MIENIDTERCSGCGRCEEVCPMDVFRLDRLEKKTVARYPQDCQTCFICELVCPAGAIRVRPFRKKRVQAWGG